MVPASLDSNFPDAVQRGADIQIRPWTSTTAHFMIRKDVQHLGITHFVWILYADKRSRLERIVINDRADIDRSPSTRRYKQVTLA